MTSFAHDSRELAETYDRLSNRQLEGGKRLVERMAIAGGASVLDVGCGTGRLARFIAERVGAAGHVVGIDPLPGRVELARANGGDIRFEVGQAEDLHAFDECSFDAVCMSSVFHWIEDKQKALSEVRRVLRAGGRVGVTTFPHELREAGTAARAVRSIFQRAPYAGHVDPSVLTFAKRGYTTTDLITLVLEAGLELGELHIAPRDSVHTSAEELVEFMESSSFGNLLRIVPEALWTSLRADLVSTFESQRTAEGIRLRDWGLVFIAARPSEPMV